MNDLPPSDDSPQADSANEPDPAAQLLLLQQEHRALDDEIAALYKYPYRDQLLLQRLKKKKLRIKDEIERLKDDMIPDLNA